MVLLLSEKNIMSYGVFFFFPLLICAIAMAYQIVLDPNARQAKSESIFETLARIFAPSKRTTKPSPILAAIIGFFENAAHVAQVYAKNILIKMFMWCEVITLIVFFVLMYSGGSWATTIFGDFVYLVYFFLVSIFLAPVISQSVSSTAATAAAASSSSSSSSPSLFDKIGNAVMGACCMGIFILSFVLVQAHETVVLRELRKAHESGDKRVEANLFHAGSQRERMLKRRFDNCIVAVVVFFFLANFYFLYPQQQFGTENAQYVSLATVVFIAIVDCIMFHTAYTLNRGLKSRQKK